MSSKSWLQKQILDVNLLFIVTEKQTNSLVLRNSCTIPLLCSYDKCKKLLIHLELDFSSHKIYPKESSKTNGSIPVRLLSVSDQIWLVKEQWNKSQCQTIARNESTTSTLVSEEQLKHLLILRQPLGFPSLKGEFANRAVAICYIYQSDKGMRNLCTSHKKFQDFLTG